MIKHFLTTVAVAFFSFSASAAVIFSDHFDGSLPATAQNADIPNWLEQNGSIDYIKHGAFGISCLGAIGGCLDMDGSTGDAADLRSSTIFSLVAGNTYELSYWFSGNQRGGAGDSMTVSFVGQVDVHNNIPFNAPFTQFFITVTPLSDTTSDIVFSHAGGDNFGLILDSVVLTETTVIPEPSTLALCGLALAGVAFLRRRS